MVQRRWSRESLAEAMVQTLDFRDNGPETMVQTLDSRDNGPDSGPWSFSRESRRGGGAAAARGRARAEDACAFIGARHGRRYGGGRPVRNRLVPGAGSPERFGPNRSGRTARGSAPHAVEASTRRRRVSAVSARSPSRRARGPAGRSSDSSGLLRTRARRSRTRRARTRGAASRSPRTDSRAGPRPLAAPGGAPPRHCRGFRPPSRADSNVHPPGDVRAWGTAPPRVWGHCLDIPHPGSDVASAAPPPGRRAPHHPGAPGARLAARARGA